MALVVKNLLANAGDERDTGSIPGPERSSGAGHGNPLLGLPGESHGQKSVAWQVTVHGITKSRT